MRTHEFEVDLSKVRQLSFIGEVHPFFFKHNGEFTKGVLLPVQEEKFEKLMTLLAGDDRYELKKGDKIYKIPPCRMDGETVKRIAARIGAVVVDDVAKATVLLGNDSLGRVMEKVETPSKDDLFFRHDYLEKGKFNFRHTWKDTVASKSLAFGYNNDLFVVNVDHDPVYGELPPSRWMTPMGFTIVHRWLTGKLPVMSEDYFLGLDEKEKMDVDRLAKIKELLLQDSASSVKVAREMLLRTDPNDPATMVELFLWAQDKELKDTIKGFTGRTKREQLFLDKTLLKSLPGMSHGDFLYTMKDVMTPVLLSRLEGIENDYHRLDCSFNALGISKCYTLKLVPKEGMEHILKEI
jgi:hypothetical protein